MPTVSEDPSTPWAAGSSTFRPLLDTGELEFGADNGADMALAHRGPGLKIGGRSPFPHTPIHAS